MAFDRPWNLHPGRLTQRVTLQEPTTPTDGETNPAFATIVDGIPAEIVAAAARGYSGNEVGRGLQVEGKTVWVVTIRYRSDINPTWQVVWGTRTLQIYSCYDAIGTSTMLEMLCYEVTP